MTRMMNLNRHLEVARRRMTDDNNGYLYAHFYTLVMFLSLMVCCLHTMGVGLVLYRSK